MESKKQQDLLVVHEVEWNNRLEEGGKVWNSCCREKEWQSTRKEQEDFRAGLRVKLWLVLINL